MTNRYDALAVNTYLTKDGEEKTFFTKIGTMWTNKNNNGFTLDLNAYPLPNKEGKVRVIIKEPTERDGYKRNEPAVAQKKISEAIDDDIPF
jgi:hypothetical protein